MFAIWKQLEQFILEIIRKEMKRIEQKTTHTKKQMKMKMKMGKKRKKIKPSKAKKWKAKQSNQD